MPFKIILSGLETFGRPFAGGHSQALVGISQLPQQLIHLIPACRCGKGTRHGPALIALLQNQLLTLGPVDSHRADAVRGEGKKG